MLSRFLITGQQSKMILRHLSRRLLGISAPRFSRVVVTSFAFKSTLSHSSPPNDDDEAHTLMDELRTSHANEISSLPEQKALSELHHFLTLSSTNGNTSSDPYESIFHHVPPTPPPNGYTHTMSEQQIQSTIHAAMATFHLHCEARIAALVGHGYYTIGPCGEELLSSIAHTFVPDDAVALHYRHLGVSILRQLNGGKDMDEILLDRARGYCVSKFDPVTGGVHCAIGSGLEEGQQEQGVGGGDYVVTSTLASQCPSAVGRALGFSVASKLLDQSKDKKTRKKKKTRPVSFVTLGDGSIHNGHFLSSYNMAKHARHRRIKCPVVFGISDNGISISYKTDGYTDTLFHNTHDDGGDGTTNDIIPVFRANGRDMCDIYDQTYKATQYARSNSAPVVILYQNITRRFGHAATDRQFAYLQPEEINAMAETDVIEGAIRQSVEILNVGTYDEYKDKFEEIGLGTRMAFNLACEEEKVDRVDMLDRVSAPMVPVPRLGLLGKEEPDKKTKESEIESSEVISSQDNKKKNQKKKDVMRKHMTRVFTELMEDDPTIVYIGEDVEHGGYYLVTDNLSTKFPNGGRVVDFPPDETTLIGVGMGYAQCGLLPIVEIPYAKYLDCGVDMFYEVAIMNWLTNGTKSNGMVLRMQGFDRGKFGGNFHTHNMLSHVPPGVDVVCYSNGEDYVRGLRNAIKQAKNGRVVMTIDCTYLLNLRHLFGKDRGWERYYPTDREKDVMSFHDIRCYGTPGKGRYGIVTYGNGVVTSLQARKALFEAGHIDTETDIDIIDCPYLSSVPDGLREIMDNYNNYDVEGEGGGGVIFADICKEGPGSNVLSSMIPTLQKEGILPQRWEFVGAPRTYNPLGSVVTFLNVEDVVNAFTRLTKKRR